MNKKQARLNAIVSDFNAKFPVGTEVVLVKDSGAIRTRVRGEAALLGGHTPVAWFNDVSGCHAIDKRVLEVPHG